MGLGYEDVVFNQEITERRRSKSNACALEEISWYHGDMQRTAAEILLLSDGILEGTYLLRKSRRHDDYAVSVRCEGSVKHFMLSFSGKAQSYIFGNASFYTIQELLDHFESCPILSRDNDVPVTLINPLNVDLDNEPDDYMEPVEHIEGGANLFKKQEVTPHSGSKSGYLHKRGAIRTNWKRRWFTVDKKSLKYFDNRRTEKPIRDLDISTATSVEKVVIDQKRNSFQLVFPHRTFYFYTSTANEAKDWITFFQWKIDFYNKR
ncbi:dual adapter for phosphotyrosine and 3-phosphotyrosine and 3-phosphoinositide-like isoform X1 [Clytia hemisphaerica]|uniref:Dual adapter for phosphotyrosine and 3-phosphotyrosine and 3-phosphoinositide n=1 Tax=Clytia hemisphaerica TaxID=252671 RepID=A0A7M5XHJ7_9CNID